MYLQTSWKSSLFIKPSSIMDIHLTDSLEKKKHFLVHNLYFRHFPIANGIHILEKKWCVPLDTNRCTGNYSLWSYTQTLLGSHPVDKTSKLKKKLHQCILGINERTAAKHVRPPMSPLLASLTSYSGQV